MTTLEDIDTVKRALLADDTGALDALVRIVDRLVSASEEHAMALKSGGDALENYRCTMQGAAHIVTDREGTAFVSGYVVADLQGRWSEWYRKRSIFPEQPPPLAACRGCFSAAEHIGALHDLIMGSNPQGWAASSDLPAVSEWAKLAVDLMASWPKVIT